MKIKLKCFAMLANAQNCDYRGSSEHDIPDGATIANLMERVEIPAENVKLIFCNGKTVDADTVLKDGDQVALAPAVYGM